MDINRINKGAETPPYPKNVEEWRCAISHGFGLTPIEGKALCQDGTFPFDAFTAWLRKEFSADKGYSLDFSPALVRNHRGLVAWVYGDGSEPYWPGHDEDTRAKRKNAS